MALRWRQVEPGGSRVDIELGMEGEGVGDRGVLRSSEVVAMVNVEQLVAERWGQWTDGRPVVMYGGWSWTPGLLRYELG